MFCPKCRKEIEEETQFCKYCGANLAVKEKEITKQPKTSGLAIVSLVLGILFFIPFAPLLAVVFGIIALVKISKGKGELKGQGMAIAGLVLGGLMIIFNIGILAFIALPRFMDQKEQAKRTATMIQIKNFEGGLKLFKLDNGFYPSTEEGLKALVEKPTTGREAKNWKEGGYLEAKEIPLDLWGNPYVYVSPGVHNKEYDIVSYGADGVEGGEENDADIQSWALER